MKLKKVFFFILLFNCLIFSQDKGNSYYRSILFSFKAGYHTGSNLSMDEGFPDGIVYDGSIALGISKNIILGINFDYWKRDNVVTHPSLTDITINKNYNAFGYKVYAQYRNTVFKIINLYGDLGLGRYKISNNYYYGNSLSSDNNYYLNAGISFGAGIRVNKYLDISAEVSHYRLIKFLIEGGGVSTTNFKFGPTFYFKLK